MKEQSEIAREKEPASAFLIGERFYELIKSYKLRYNTGVYNGSK